MQVEAAVMQEAPTTGWSSQPLSELIAFATGGAWGDAPDAVDGKTLFEVACIRGTDFRDWDERKARAAVSRGLDAKSLEKRKLQAGDILLEVSGGGPEQPVGRTILIDKEAVESAAGRPMVPTNFLRLLRLKEDVDPAYVNYYLKYFYVTGGINDYQGGSNNLRNLRFKDYVTIEVPLAPLPQQRRIVEAIELQLGRLDAAVARLQGAKARLKRYKQAVLKAAVDEAIENGDMVPLEDLIVSIGQGWSPKCLNEPSPNEETWGVIKTTAIQPGTYVQEENKELPSTLKPRPEHELKAGDLLVTRAGPRSRVGITCLVRETRSRLMNCDKAYRLRFDGERVEPAYIEMLLNAPQVTDQLDELKTGISDSGVNLTQGRFLSLEMPVIKRNAQRELIARTQAAAASVDETETTLDAQLQQAVRLRQAVLKRAFEGRLV